VRPVTHLLDHLAGRATRALKLGALLACLALAACKVDLYSDLTEVEANQMLAVLMSSSIVAEKVHVDEGFQVRVEDRDMVQAIAVLTAKGFPKNTRDSMGTVFQKSGIISSPFEERVRYIYALGEEVAQTLSEIDGVVTARVHVVLPGEPQLGEPVVPSSAAVFIKHEANVDLEFLVPQIRRLVSSSIEGLQYNAVTVVLTEASQTEVAPPASAERVVEVIQGLGVREANLPLFWTIIYVAGGAIVVLLALVIAAAVLLFMRRRPKGSGSQVGAADGTALEPS
jgi:type III secretion protein J